MDLPEGHWMISNLGCYFNTPVAVPGVTRLTISWQGDFDLLVDMVISTLGHFPYHPKLASSAGTRSAE